MRIPAAIFVLCLVGGGADVAVRVTSDKAGGVYEPGAKVVWTVESKDLSKMSYQVKVGGLTVSAKGDLELKDGKATVEATRADAGVLILELKGKGPDGKDVTALGAAAFAPEKIAPSSPAPEDFDAFWKKKLEELAAVPANVQLTPAESGSADVEYFKVTMDNIRGRKIRGQLARPKGKSGLPGLLQVQWAGVYGLPREWVTGHAKAGWLAMNISAHDLPIDEKAEFYQEKAKKELDDYPGIGNEDRETSYFLPMFLSCHRAVEELTKLKEWNGKTVVVHGGSQGGYQAIVTAGLHPAVTGFAANVPAGCDHTGKAAGRAPGWPYWASRAWKPSEKDPAQKRSEKAMLEAARYFDAMNFAPRAKGAGLIGVGLVDTVCPAEGVFATVNRLAGPKKVVIMPQADHSRDHKAYYAEYGPFLESQKAR
jgi:cephalosporin-C deacetylase-like acetyl esterase